MSEKRYSSAAAKVRIFDETTKNLLTIFQDVPSFLSAIYGVMGNIVYVIYTVVCQSYPSAGY